MKGKNVRGLILIVLISAILSLQVGDGQAKTKKIRLAHTGGPGSAVDLTYIKFKELLEKETNGELEVVLYGSGTLAGDQTAVEGAQRGTIDMGSAGTNNMAPFTDKFLFGDLPYIMDSIESSHKIWGGEIGAELRKAVGDQLGIKGLFFVDVGSFRVLGNNKKPVHVPADLAGLKIRATATPVEQAILKAWGASPTPVTWPEVYMALEQKVVDGTYVQHMWTVTAKHHEAMDYYTETGGVQNMHLCFMSNRTWNQLSEKQQKAVLKVAAETQAYSFDIASKMVDKLREEMVEAGGKIYYPKPEEMTQWKAIKNDIWNQFSDRIDMDFVQRVVEAQR